MTVNINFYVGKSNSLKSRLLLACKLIEKALEQGLVSYIHLDNQQNAEKMDEMLWIYRDVSFIPHVILPVNDKVPVFIGNAEENIDIPKADFLINLSNQIPEFLTQFAKIAEIIDQEDQILDEGRKRYAYYRKQGYTLNYHQL